MNLVIFDVDGTLLNNLRCEDDCYTQALREGLGIQTLAGDWNHYEHVSDQGIAIEAFSRSFGTLPSAEALTTTVGRFVELLRSAHHTEPIVSVDGASETLRDLPKKGWATAIATGAWRRAAEFKLAAAGIPYETLPMATAEDGPARTDIVTAARVRAEQAHGFTFGRVVAVGDGVWDVDAARSLAIPFVGLATGARAERLRAAGASTVLAHFSNIHATLSALETAGCPFDAVP